MPHVHGPGDWIRPLLEDEVAAVLPARPTGGSARRVSGTRSSPALGGPRCGTLERTRGLEAHEGHLTGTGGNSRHHIRLPACEPITTAVVRRLTRRLWWLVGMTVLHAPCDKLTSVLPRPSANQSDTPAHNHRARDQPKTRKPHGQHKDSTSPVERVAPDRSTPVRRRPCSYRRAKASTNCPASGGDPTRRETRTAFPWS
jgi:hypothetical protein